MIEERFDPIFATRLGLREKQIQQSYRPVIGVHKWFARRPGSVFRSLLLSEFVDAPVAEAYWQAHDLRGVIGDPFMGGGTPVIEANRLGFNVVGVDINPVAYWTVRQSLTHLDAGRFEVEAERVARDVARQVGALYRTRCLLCDGDAEAKYFLWVKVQVCPGCGQDCDLFPGHMLAEATRHPKFVVLCRGCGHLNECNTKPTREAPASCSQCSGPVHVEGNAKRNRARCGCGEVVTYPPAEPNAPPRHRMWAMEYHCAACKPTHKGRFFKAPDADDLARVERARRLLEAQGAALPCPASDIPDGDETRRLLRWGYACYSDMFNARQRLGLGLLLRRIGETEDVSIRHALATVFSDFLRYQNMLARYDTYALKCQDIFSMHAFPVGLIQCENNVLGIPKVGSGAFRHFVAKYLRAKAYCEAPFEIEWRGKKKRVHAIAGESIQAELSNQVPRKNARRQAWLWAGSSADVQLRRRSLDGVFTDPPYFDNVQYAELMDFCYAWLRLALEAEVEEFAAPTTRAPGELTGNVTAKRGLLGFTEGLSRVFRNFAAALKPGAPFVFTYHHNQVSAYLPLVVAILDAGLDCTATLPVAAEMTASRHIAGTGSSILDSVFVCRRPPLTQERSLRLGAAGFQALLEADARSMRGAGIAVKAGELQCLAAGHAARLTINALRSGWRRTAPLETRFERARRSAEEVSAGLDIDAGLERLAAELHSAEPRRAKVATVGT